MLLNVLGGQRRPRTARSPATLASIDARVAFLQAAATELSTQKGYATGARDYISFCITHHLPLDPTPSTLARYIAYTSRFIRSAPKYLSGARHFLQDIYPDFRRNRAHPLVQATIHGSRKVHADSVTRKLPLRPLHLASFARLALHSGLYDDLLFATILSCAFYACHRIGELIKPNDRSLWDWRKTIKRASLHFLPARVSYHLPYHKGDRFYHGTTILHLRQAVACPVDLLANYVSCRDRCHGARAALFLCADGSEPTV